MYSVKGLGPQTQIRNVNLVPGQKSKALRLPIPASPPYLWQNCDCQTRRVGIWGREQKQQGDLSQRKACLASPFQGWISLYSLLDRQLSSPGNPQVGYHPRAITVWRGTEPGTSNTRTEKTHHAFDLYLYLHGLCGKTKGKRQGEQSVSKSRDPKHQAACYSQLLGPSCSVIRTETQQFM